jgi:glycogen debranching enzyme
MPSFARALRLNEILLFASVSVLSPLCPAQGDPAPQLAPVFSSLAPVAFDTSGPVIRAHTESLKPFTVAGQRGVLVGQQDGAFESWILPVKLLSHFTVEADVAGYGVPIDVNQQSAEIEVRPDRTVLTYSHPAFTVRQIMFSPGAGPTGTAPIVLFEFDCLHPTDFIFRFTPELRWMWPERNEGAPSAEWISPDPHNPTAAGGFYVLHTDYPDLAGALTIPGATPGILAPYQERPQVHPVEFTLHIDPARDQKRLFPLLMAAGTSSTTATNAALASTLAQLNASIPALYQTHAETYKKLLANSVSLETPDQSLNEAFQWAIVSIEQLKTKIIPGQSSPPPPTLGAPGPSLSGTGDPAETALVAGYFTSADSARPGFGWFFGRDALYTLYAVNGYGDFALTKSELEFLIHRQRADGKIMHEYSQTAAAIDWQSFPYMYAAADSTPLFLLAVADYVRASGDTAFLTEHRDAIEKAWAFETDPAHDTDHDGIYDNSHGTGWVESWPGGMPHQEIYLALLDQQASSAVAYIEDQLKDSAKSADAQQRANKIATTINTEYYDPQKSCYAFSHNLDGSNDRTTTVYPAIAWWDPPNQNSILDHPEACLRNFAASALNTDWGLRDVSNQEKIYDGLSYHQGSVWPLFTGWAALAEYRANQPLAGYQLLKENANLTWAQDLGADTELLSGDFFVPFGRSTSHQLWSSAMVITPTLRGLFGISIDAQAKTITVNPHLPASWDHAAIHHLSLPGGEETVSFDRNGAVLEVTVSDDHHTGFRLRSDLPSATSAQLPSGSNGIRIPLPPLEISVPFVPPLPGARTENPRIVSETWAPAKATLVFEGPAGATANVEILRRSLLPHLKVDSPQNKTTGPADTTPQVAITTMDEAGARDPSVPIELTIHFPQSSTSSSSPNWQTLTVTLSW